MKKLEICLKDHSEFLKTKSGQDFLAELAKSKDGAVLKKVAECQEISIDLLKGILNRIINVKNVMWDDGWNMYRTLTSIANNVAADALILDCICDFVLKHIEAYPHESRTRDILVDTLKVIGRNTHTGEATFIKLLDSHIKVKAAVAGNTAISDEFLIQIVENHTEDEVRAAAAKQLAQRFKALKQAQNV